MMAEIVHTKGGLCKGGLAYKKRPSSLPISYKKILIMQLFDCLSIFFISIDDALFISIDDSFDTIGIGWSLTTVCSRDDALFGVVKYEDRKLNLSISIIFF